MFVQGFVISIRNCKTIDVLVIIVSDEMVEVSIVLVYVYNVFIGFNRKLGS